MGVQESTILLFYFSSDLRHIIALLSILPPTHTHTTFTESWPNSPRCHTPSRHARRTPIEASLGSFLLP